MNWAFKSVAVIALLAFLSPALMAVSNCVGKGLETGRCQPNCPMTEMNSDPSDHVSATLVKGSCCKMSSRLPVTNQAAVTPQTSVTGAVQLPISAPRAGLPPDRFITAQGTAPPLCACSHQALLCTFLV